MEFFSRSFIEFLLYRFDKSVSKHIEISLFWYVLPDELDAMWTIITTRKLAGAFYRVFFVLLMSLELSNAT